MTKTIQIEGMDELIEAVGSGGGGGGGGNIPTPTLDDDGKVLRVVSQSQEEVAPEWSTVREVPIDGRNGQVLTKNSEGYEWAAPSGGLPELYGEEDKGKVLMAQYDSDTESTYPAWSTIKQVPTGGTKGQVLTRTSGSGYGWGNVPTPEKELPSISSGDSGKLLQAWYDSEEGYGYTAWGTVASVPNSSASDAGKVLTCTGKNKYGWAAAASGGGGHIDVIRFDISKSEFTQDGSVYKAYINGSYPNLLTKIDNTISISIVDNVDSGSPTFTIPSNDDDCSIYMNGDDGMISISSTIYASLGTREATHFYLTYYTGA